MVRRTRLRASYPENEIVENGVGGAVEDAAASNRGVRHVEDTMELILHSISITLSLILVTTWNSFIYAQLGKRVFSHVPGLEDRGSLMFLVFTTLFVSLLFAGLSWVTDGEIQPKRIFAGMGPKPFTPGTDIR